MRECGCECGDLRISLGVGSLLLPCEGRASPVPAAALSSGFVGPRALANVSVSDSYPSIGGLGLQKRHHSIQLCRWISGIKHGPSGSHRLTHGGISISRGPDLSLSPPQYYMCTGVLRGHRRVLDPLELKLQITVS